MGYCVIKGCGCKYTTASGYCMFTCCKLYGVDEKGNAIPIEWIDTYCTDCSIDLRDNDAGAIEKLLKDWKEENENS